MTEEILWLPTYRKPHWIRRAVSENVLGNIGRSNLPRIGIPHRVCNGPNRQDKKRYRFKKFPSSRLLLSCQRQGFFHNK